MSRPPRSSGEREQRLGDRAAVDAPGALRRRATRARRRVPAARAARRHGAASPPARRSAAPSRSVNTGASISRHAACAGGSGTPSRASRSRRLDEPGPGQAAVRPPERVQPRGHAGHRARGGADRVVDELLAEGHVEVQELRLAPCRAEPRDGAEAVEIACQARLRVEVDRVAAAQQPGHDGLGDAGGEPGRNRGVRGRAAVGEHLDPGGGRRGVPCGDAGRHGSARGRATQPTRAKPGCGKSSRWLISSAAGERRRRRLRAARAG